ncbi:hypothetical protein S245_048997 [Arachis hypogaea]
MVLILDESGVQELPSTIQNLVGLEELSLHGCRSLVFIVSSIGHLSKLSILDLTYCEALESLPSSIFNLKLTKLDLHGYSMLKTLPEIMEPAESFAHMNLVKTTIKEIPSSLAYLVGLQTLQLNLCKDLEFLPNSIGNLNLLSKLDFSGCEKLSELPSDIGNLSSLRKLSLHESSIVDLPESIAHLSSLKSLDLSDCKKLENIPVLPPFLEHFVAFDCPSVRRVSNSGFDIKLTSNSKDGIFKFHLTNSQELTQSSKSNIAGEAWQRMLDNAYRSSALKRPYDETGEKTAVQVRRQRRERMNQGRDNTSWSESENTGLWFQFANREIKEAEREVEEAEREIEEEEREVVSQLREWE